MSVKPGPQFFCRFITNQALHNESERLKSIYEGLSPTLFLRTFRLKDKQVEALLNVSVSTFLRRRRDATKNLDAVTSDCLARVVTVRHLALKIFEDQPAAIDWVSHSNKALGGQTPIMLCSTDVEENRFGVCSK